MKNVFSCKRCGYCCHGETTVSLDEEDQKRILDFLGISMAEALEKYLRLTDGVLQMKTVNGHCIFFADGCTIHPGRPWRCRQWPLVPAIILDESNLGAISESCPGIIKDAIYEEVCKAVREEKHYRTIRCESSFNNSKQSK